MIYFELLVIRGYPMSCHASGSPWPWPCPWSCLCGHLSLLPTSDPLQPTAAVGNAEIVPSPIAGTLPTLHTVSMQPHVLSVHALALRQAPATQLVSVGPHTHSPIAGIPSAGAPSHRNLSGFLHFFAVSAYLAAGSPEEGGEEGQERQGRAAVF